MILPKIAVCFYADGDQLLRSELSLDSQFHFEIKNGSKQLTDLVSTWIDSYLKKKPLPFSLQPAGTPFQQSVWKALDQIPFGQPLSYGQLAKNIGKGKAARAVGAACGRNPLPLLIPCHRVIQANKTLGGFAFDLEIKRRLLEFERLN